MFIVISVYMCTQVGICAHDYFKQQVCNMNMIETLLGISFDSNSALGSLHHMDVGSTPLSKIF
jgi:hypothetical protein